MKDSIFFLGAGLVVIGLWVISPALSLIVSGVFLWVLSFSLPESDT